MERRDWETLVLALEGLGLIVESVHRESGTVTVRVPELRWKETYHL